MKRTISKITVNAGGLKGLILEGREDVAKNNKITEDGFKLTKKHPISRDLEDKIKEFRFFALNICGLITDSTPKSDKLMLIDQCDVSSLDFVQGVTGYFKIKVASRVFDTKTITLSTPKVDSSDDYKWFDEVMKMLDGLLVEVDQYEKGLKKISDEDLMISFIRHGKNKEMTMDKLNEMTPEEKVDWLIAEGAKYVCLVMQIDENYVPDSEEVVSLETKAEEPLMLEMEMGEEKEYVNEEGERRELTDEEASEIVFGKVAEPIKLKK